MPWARSHLHSGGPCPYHASFTVRSSCSLLCGSSSSLGINVTIAGHLCHSVPLACDKTPSINLGLIELSFNSKEFGREILTKPSMFGKLEVHASEAVWRFEPITFYIKELRVKLILAVHAVLK